MFERQKLLKVFLPSAAHVCSAVAQDMHLPVCRLFYVIRPLSCFRKAFNPLNQMGCPLRPEAFFSNIWKGGRLLRGRGVFRISVFYV